MDRQSRNFWVDLPLLLLLGLTACFLFGAGSDTPEAHPNAATHFHAVFGMFLMLGSFLHVLLHGHWIKAVLRGKSAGRNRIRLVMNGMVTMFMLLACISGHEAITSAGVSRFHSLVGSLALVGLFIHSIKHVRWMARVSKRAITGGRPGRIGYRGTNGNRSVEAFES